MANKQKLALKRKAAEKKEELVKEEVKPSKNEESDQVNSCTRFFVFAESYHESAMEHNF